MLINQVLDGSMDGPVELSKEKSNFNMDELKT